jgi:hypothetical protein
MLVSGVQVALLFGEPAVMDHPCWSAHPSLQIGLQHFATDLKCEPELLCFPERDMPKLCAPVRLVSLILSLVVNLL